MLGDIVAGGLGALGISWQSAPALTELEQVVCDWARQLCGLSDGWSGTIYDGASTASPRCAAGRPGNGHRWFPAAGRAAGRGRPAHRLLLGRRSLVCHQRRRLLAGYGAENLRLVPPRQPGREMDVTALASLMAEDVAAGRRPAAVVATAGTTATTAFDPLADVCEVAAQYGAFVHVDAAMAGSAMLLPECRGLFDGIEGASSVELEPSQVVGVRPGDLAFLCPRTRGTGVCDVDRPELLAFVPGRRR